MPESATPSTIDHLAPSSERAVRGRRLLYTVSTLLMTALMLMAVLDGVGWGRFFGVISDEVSATGGGYELEVQYGKVSRPALATPFEIRIRRDGGFDGPITVAVDRAYLKLWDENGLFPGPSAETGDGEMVNWEFDPPAGDELVVTFDARIEPAAQRGARGFVAVLEGDRPVVRVDFETHVRP